MTENFVEVMNRIKDECRSHDTCGMNCIFFRYMDTDGNCICTLNVPPEYLDPLDILRRLQDGI